MNLHIECFFWWYSVFWVCFCVFSVFVEIKFLCWNRCHNTRSNERNRVCIQPNLAIPNHIYPIIFTPLQLDPFVCDTIPEEKAADDCRCCQILTEVVMSCHVWKVVPMSSSSQKITLSPLCFIHFTYKPLWQKKAFPPISYIIAKWVAYGWSITPPDCIHFALMYDTNGVTLYPLCFILFTKTVFFEFYVKAGYPPSFIHCKKCKKNVWKGRMYITIGQGD